MLFLNKNFDYIDLQSKISFLLTKKRIKHFQEKKKETQKHIASDYITVFSSEQLSCTRGRRFILSSNRQKVEKAFDKFIVVLISLIQNSLYS